LRQGVTNEKRDGRRDGLELLLLLSIRDERLSRGKSLAVRVAAVHTYNDAIGHAFKRLVVRAVL
jgi:hypothetical protein